MYLMYYLDDAGNRVYTLKKVDPSGQATKSAHPGIQPTACLARLTKLYGIARFSPDDKFSRHRVTIKKRFGIFMAQPAQKTA